MDHKLMFRWSNVVIAMLMLAACSNSNTSTGDEKKSPGDGDYADSADANLGISSPLPKGTLLFKRVVRSHVEHIYAYDTVANQERLITKLDDTGTTGTGTEVYGLALSPDRRWIAFVALFRPSQADYNTGLSTSAVWVVSVDGQTFRRVSATVPNPYSSTPCTTDTNCAKLPNMYCQGIVKHCQPYNYHLEVLNPSWSPDGKTIYVAFGQYAMTSRNGRLTGGTSIASVPFAGGSFKLYSASASNCGVVANPAISPQGNALLAVQSLCSGSGFEGLTRWSAPPSGGPKPLVAVTAMGPIYDIDLNSNPIWLSDGEGVFLAEVGYQQGSTSVRGNALLSIQVGTQQVPVNQISVQIAPLTGSYKLAAFAVSPDETKVAVEVAYTSGSRTYSDIYLVEQSTQNTWKRLTTTGNSVRPAW